MHCKELSERTQLVSSELYHIITTFRQRKIAGLYTIQISKYDFFLYIYIFFLLAKMGYVCRNKLQSQYFVMCVQYKEARHPKFSKQNSCLHSWDMNGFTHKSNAGSVTTRKSL